MGDRFSCALLDRAGSQRLSREDYFGQAGRSLHLGARPDTTKGCHQGSAGEKGLEEVGSSHCPPPAIASSLPTTAPQATVIRAGPAIRNRAIALSFLRG